MPPSVRTAQGAGRDGKEPYLAIGDAAGLLALVQFGAIELHPGGARADRPDRLVFDLHPAEELPFRQVVAAAQELRERLQALGLTSFPRTTGGKGLHLVVPIERRHDRREAKAFAGGLARAMAGDSPDRYIATLTKALRRGRILSELWLTGRKHEQRLGADAAGVSHAGRSDHCHPSCPEADP
jgi:bifunctional non-homologous end joining protein LigD